MRLDLGNDRMDTLHDALETVPGINRVQTIDIAVAHLVGEPGAFDQGLARYTAVIEAITSHSGRFDQSHPGLDRCRNIG